MATGNLRERLTSFVGRSTELEELKEVVRSSRLVTLISPGGVGKTRLALETAAALREEHRDGAWLVDLAGVAEAEGVAPAVAGTFGAASAGLTAPLSPSSTVELIVRYLAGRSLLVVLDNCEHLIAEAASLAETLVGALPGLRLVATSRSASLSPAKSWCRCARWPRRQQPSSSSTGPGRCGPGSARTGAPVA
jgi:predicted ATPase